MLFQVGRCEHCKPHGILGESRECEQCWNATIAQVHITEKTLACLEEEEKETYQPRLVDHMTDEVAGGVVDLLGGFGERDGYLPDSKQDG